MKSPFTEAEKQVLIKTGGALCGICKRKGINVVANGVKVGYSGLCKKHYEVAKELTDGNRKFWNGFKAELRKRIGG